jgi:regulator of sirC expression with transglutaminase-like and TPR domain
MGQVMDPESRVFHDLVAVPDAEVDLGRAAFAIARIQYPELVAETEMQRLDDLAARAAKAGAQDRGDGLGRLRAFLFEAEGFRGNADEYYDPRNSCLNDVMDRKLGIPITLSVLMIEVGRRLGISITGVGLPGHFIVGAEVDARRLYIDPFHGGSVITPETAAEVASRAVGRPVKLEQAHWAPCSKRQIVIRMLRNLKTIYARQTEWGRALTVVDRLLLIDCDSPTHLRDRGTVLVKLGRLRDGAAEWERYLTRFPNAQDADNFRQELRRVRQELGSLN